MKLYHVSEKPLLNLKLTPRVPDNFMTRLNYENKTINRVCFSTSIDNCLTALGQILKGKELYVYSLNTISYNTYTPSLNEVPDVNLTNEVWVLDECNVEYEFKIKVIDVEDESLKYTYGFNEGELYKFKYIRCDLNDC